MEGISKELNSELANAYTIKKDDYIEHDITILYPYQKSLIISIMLFIIGIILLPIFYFNDSSFGPAYAVLGVWGLFSALTIHLYNSSARGGLGFVDKSKVYIANAPITKY